MNVAQMRPLKFVHSLIVSLPLTRVVVVPLGVVLVSRMSAGRLNLKTVGLARPPVGSRFMTRVVPLVVLLVPVVMTVVILVPVVVLVAFVLGIPLFPVVEANGVAKNSLVLLVTMYMLVPVVSSVSALLYMLAMIVTRGTILEIPVTAVPSPVSVARMLRFLVSPVLIEPQNAIIG